MRIPLKRVAAVALSLGTVPARAQSPLELMAQVPQPPEQVQVAVTWWQDGQAVAPELKAIHDVLRRERLARETAANASIEAGEVEAGLARAYAQYLAENEGKEAPDATLAKRTRWLQSAMGGRLGKLLGRMQPCGLPCDDAGVIAHNAALEPERQHLAGQELQMWRALFTDWKQARLPALRRGQQWLDSAAGSKLSEQGQGVLAHYRDALYREVELLMSITELAVRRSVAIQSGQTDAISGPSRSARAQ